MISYVHKTRVYLSPEPIDDRYVTSSWTIRRQVRSIK